MIHGAFCAGWAFDDYRSAVRGAGAQVYRADAAPSRALRRARGRRASWASPACSTMRPTSRRWCASLNAPPVLIGHSMGGLVAQIVATRVPVQGAGADRAVGALGHPADQPVGDHVGAGALFRGAVLEQAAAARGVDRREPCARPAAAEAARGGVRALRAGIGAGDVRDHALGDGCQARDLCGRATRSTCPVLCVAGGLDRVNPPKTVASIARRYRERGQYFEVETASHWLIGEPGWEKTARDPCASGRQRHRTVAA